MVTNSVVVLVVRKGNPKAIHTWDDLLKPGIDVVTPDVFQSGGAKWNLLAAYGASQRSGASPDAARGYLKSLLSHVNVQPASGREALTTFVGGKGDVLLSYENEAITAQQAGQPVDYVVPTSTILIENPVAVVKTLAQPGSGAELSRVPAQRRRPASVGTARLSPGRLTSVAAERSPAPTQPRLASSPSTTWAAGPRSTSSSSTATTAW